jgi:hypothetical protein
MEDLTVAGDKNVIIHLIFDISMLILDTMISNIIRKTPNTPI